jgi:hypothetical protein
MVLLGMILSIFRLVEDAFYYRVPRVLSGTKYKQSCLLLPAESPIFVQQQWEQGVENYQSSSVLTEPQNMTLNQSDSQNKNRFERRRWCPNDAKCDNNFLCEPCQRRFLILISEPRAASTTLTWMLDTLPGIRMSGENNDLLTHLQWAVHQTTEHPSFKNGFDVNKNPWYHNPIIPGSLACAAQSLVHALNPPNGNDDDNELEMTREESEMILGFKTVRFHKGYDLNDKDSVLKLYDKILFLLESFPCSKIIVNTRSDIDSHVKSIQAAFRIKREKEIIKERLEMEGRTMTSIHRYLLQPKGKKGSSVISSNSTLDRNDRVILMDSTEWTKDVTKLRRLIDWLGYSPECYFTELLEYNLPRSKTRKGRAFGYARGRTEFSNRSPNCRYLGLSDDEGKGDIRKNGGLQI